MVLDIVLVLIVIEHIKHIIIVLVDPITRARTTPSAREPHRAEHNRFGDHRNLATASNKIRAKQPNKKDKMGPSTIASSTTARRREEEEASSHVLIVDFLVLLILFPVG
jgi:hypothetical protein